MSRSLVAKCSKLGAALYQLFNGAAFPQGHPPDVVRSVNIDMLYGLPNQTLDARWRQLGR